MEKLNIHTIAVHESGQPIDEHGSVVAPICLSTTFSNRNLDPNQYIRTGNPTRDRLEGCIALLERSSFCASFASGSAAMDAIFEAVDVDGVVVASDDLYGGSHRFLANMERKGRIKLRLANLTSDSALEEAARMANVRLVWMESCTNPILRIVDIPKICSLFRKSHPDAIIVVDNTFLTPYLIRPLEMGCDIVSHSLTKYINGHCDVLMGAVCTNSPALIERIRYYQNAIGGVPSPFDCYLVLRGIKTFPMRMQRHVENAMAIARHLSRHPRVKRVVYPGLESHPDHETAAMYLKGYGGMISMETAGNPKRFVERLELFTVAESLGGVESLVEIPSLMTHAGVPLEQREALGITDELVRMSIGIEDVSDLIADLDQALASLY